jgi:hypothetical protein
MNASPLATCMTARVAMNGGTRNAATIAPENSPTPAHNSTPPREHTTNASGPASGPPARSRMAVVTSTALRAIRLPTDKSMPPVTITTVIPTARMATTAIWFATFNRFCRVRNVGQRRLSGTTNRGSPSPGNRSLAFWSNVHPAQSFVVATHPSPRPAADSRSSSIRASRGSPCTRPATSNPAAFNPRSSPSRKTVSSPLDRATRSTVRFVPPDAADPPAIRRTTCSAASAPTGCWSVRVTTA